MSKATLVLGNQLNLEHNSALEKSDTVIMIESLQLFTTYKFHKQKIKFVMSAMREFADLLQQDGKTVVYKKINDSSDTFKEALIKVLKDKNISELFIMLPSDKSPPKVIRSACKQTNTELTVTKNTLFLTPQDDFREWYSKNKKHLKMENFYQWQRKRLHILMEDDNKPRGGKWSYDHENRKSLPKNIDIPPVQLPKPTKHTKDVEEIINQHFKSNPGSIEVHWLPVNREQALAWLDEFIEVRLEHFGDYEDAMKKDSTFLYHSALSALLNIGLLHPTEIIEKVISSDAKLNNIEGFVRQIIGWREFMYGLYHHHYSDWKKMNYFNFSKKLPNSWWNLSETEHPVITKLHERLHEYGYSHHIERLMGYGNYMLLSEYDPQYVFTWFMSMYVDAYEWVMVGNVIGMSQYADGGLDNGGFATKPYISGSNYLHKMGDWWDSNKDAKNDNWTDMYWDFLGSNYEKLKDNHRLAPILSRFKN